MDPTNVNNVLLIYGYDDTDRNTFTVPTSALEGINRMRISMKWDEDPTACETFLYGEVEDYTVIINANRDTVGIPTIKIDGQLRSEAAIFEGQLTQ